MIARTWRARAAAEQAHRYAAHFESQVVPNLKRITEHRGALLLRREIGDEVEFVAITFWDNLETVKAFAGADPDLAHIEPEGRAALIEFDEFARNFEIVVDTIKGSQSP